MNLSIVDIEILSELAKAKPKLGERRVDIAAFVAKHKMSSFGEFKASGKRKRVDPNEEKERREAKKVKLTVTNGAVVDPEAFQEVPGPDC